MNFPIDLNLAIENEDTSGRFKFSQGLRES